MNDFFNILLVITICIYAFSFFRQSKFYTILKFLHNYRKTLPAQKSCVSRKEQKLIHLYKCLHDEINKQISWTRCPKCKIEDWQTKGWKIKDLDDGSSICNCPVCDHYSRWIPGPGILINIDDDDGLDQKARKALYEGNK